jgi:hypothetical protein
MGKEPYLVFCPVVITVRRKRVRRVQHAHHIIGLDSELVDVVVAFVRRVGNCPVRFRCPDQFGVRVWEASVAVIKRVELLDDRFEHAPLDVRRVLVEQPGPEVVPANPSNLAFFDCLTDWKARNSSA